MSDTGQKRSSQRNIWQTFDEKEINIILYLVHTTSPVSIDTLSDLIDAPATKVLSVMEALRRRKIVHEKKGYQKGVYFLSGTDIADFVRKHLPEASIDRKDALRKIISFYEQSPDDTDTKTLILADLYRKLEDDSQGLNIIGKAAKILSNSGNRDAALAHYDYILQHLNDGRINDDNAIDLFESILGKISLSGHLMSSQEQIQLLSGAQKLAKRFGKWYSLAEITLALGKAYQQEGDHRATNHCIKSYRELAHKTGNQKLIKRAEILMVEFLHWEGKESEVIQRYENVVGNLEEFEDNEITLKATARVGLCYVLCGRVARGFGMIDAVREKARTLNYLHVSIFCDLMTILALFEIRRFKEAEPLIDRISSFPEEVLGHYVLRPIHAVKAYILCMEGKYDEAFGNLNKVVEHSHKVGWMYHKGPWNFECMNILEKNGFYNNEMNYDSEIERSINWSDVYMKGVAYRYRAQKNLELHKSHARILSDLKNSEKYLKQSGIEIELACTQAAIGDLYLKKGETKLGQSYLRSAWLILSKIDKALFPKDLLAIMPQEHMIEVMTDRIIGINESLSTAHDMSSFLEKVVDLAMDFTMATRGAFVSLETESGEPVITASRNLDPLMHKSELLSLMKEIISAIKENGLDIFVHDKKKLTNVSNESFFEADVSSLICVPVKLAHEEYGCLYLGNRLADKPFPESSLSYLRLLSNQIAVGISKIRLYENMKALKDRFENEATFYKREMGVIAPIDTIIGKSEGIIRVVNEIHQVAQTDSLVLILGETGVGKELVAKAIHNLSDRKDGPFIPVNLAAIPSELVASELFGHEKGAFTGAHEIRKGRFELAHGGTIFLDEIGDLPLSIQISLLRVLQEGKFERLGSTKSIHSEFRVIAATNKNLRKEIEKGNFRQDLYYRIDVFPITVPPLRDRKDDIPLLARHFLDRFGKKKGMDIRKIPDNEIRKLMTYNWPGNIREFEHFIERSVILSTGDTISFSGLKNMSGEARSPTEMPLVTLAEIEREYIEKTLDATHGRVSGPNGAAVILGIKPTTLFFRMKKLGIDKKRPY